MSAGDVLFRGWTGTSPLYKELEPTVAYEPSQDRNSLLKRLTRRLICFSADKQTLIQSLPMENASVTSVYLDSNGAVQSANYGGGWTLLNMSEAEYKTGFTMISAVYERTVSRILEMGLPTNVTLAYPSEGTAQIKYKTTVLEQFATNTGSSGSGLHIRSEPIDLPTSIYAQSNNSAGLADYLNGNVLYRLWFEMDGVKFDEREVTGADLVTYGTLKGSLTTTANIAGPLAEYPNATTVESLRVAASADSAYVSTVWVNQTVSTPIQSVTVNSTIGGVYQSSYSTTDAPTYDVSIIRVPQYYVVGKWSYAAPHRAYWASSGPTYYYDGRYYGGRIALGAKWSLIGNILALKIDNLTWKQWDVSGL